MPYPLNLRDTNPVSPRAEHAYSFVVQDLRSEVAAEVVLCTAIYISPFCCGTQCICIKLT